MPTTLTVFESSRLICRRWCESDIDALYAVYSDKEGARWVDGGSPITFEECVEWLGVTKANYRTRGYGMFALDLKETRETIGFCGLVHPSNQPEPEAKYAFLPSHWGLGYASEALPKLLAYGHAQHQMNKIVATVADEHLASQRVLTKAGMQFSHSIKERDGSTTQVFVWRV